MEEPLNSQATDLEDNKPVKKDRSLLFMGIFLGIVVLVMGYLTFFVEDLSALFSGKKEPIAVVEEKSELGKNLEMDDDQVKRSLIRFIEAFYYDQRKGYFDPPSYFANITETYYNYHNLTYQRLREIHDRRLTELQNLNQNWIVSSLDFNRNGDNLVVTYWNSVSYYKKDWGKQESADIKNEMIINSEGKIISLKELETRNLVSYTVLTVPDSVGQETDYTGPGSENDATDVTPGADNLYEGKLYDLGSVEEAPQFPGGQNAFGKFLASNIRYPVEARENKVQGKVYISFVVEKSGNLTDLKILKGIGGGCDEEALRVLKNSPVWEPGIVEGKAVRTAYTFPVTFQIGE